MCDTSKDGCSLTWSPLRTSSTLSATRSQGGRVYEQLMEENNYCFKVPSFFVFIAAQTHNPHVPTIGATVLPLLFVIHTVHHPPSVFVLVGLKETSQLSPLSLQAAAWRRATAKPSQGCCPDCVSRSDFSSLLMRTWQRTAPNHTAACMRERRSLY